MNRISTSRSPLILLALLGILLLPSAARAEDWTPMVAGILIVWVGGSLVLGALTALVFAAVNRKWSWKIFFISTAAWAVSAVIGRTFLLG